MDGERNYCRKRSYFQGNYGENEVSKRRKLHDLTAEHTVYRYLCPKRKAGRVIGRGGEIMKRIREDSGARVLIEDAIQGCEERIVTISSSSKETNLFTYKKDYACPAQDALFMVHERLAIDEPLFCNEDDDFNAVQVTARLLIVSDQARCIIGRHGHVIQNMRKDTGARICIWNDELIPVCADSNEELLESMGISNSSTINNAATQLLPSCSRKEENECGEPSYVTRLLVLRSEVGGLIGKRGLIIKEMIRTTKAIISIVEDSLPSVASVDDAMVQIYGDLPNVRAGLLQVIDRLKINHFARARASASAGASARAWARARAGSTHGSVCPGRSFEPSCRGHSHPREYEASVGGSSPLEIHADPDGPQVDGDS